LGLVRAASPEMFQTFTGNLQILAGTIGLDLIPILGKATEFVAYLRDRWMSLSDSTKTTIATIAGVTVGVTALGVVLRPIGSLLVNIVAGFGKLGPAALGVTGGITAILAGTGLLVPLLQALGPIAE